MNLTTILESVWNAALDASQSPDFRNPDGSLNETAYLRYQVNVFTWAHHQLEQTLGDMFGH